MNLSISKKACLIAFAILSTYGFSQNGETISYNITDLSTEEVRNLGTPQINTTESRVVEIDFNHLSSELQDVTFQKNDYRIISVPHTDGTNHTYSVERNYTMHQDLASKYPEIVTLSGYGISHPEERAKIDVTTQGFHAMIISPKHSTVYVDPFQMGDTRNVIVYDRSNHVHDEHISCAVHGDVESETPAESTVATFGTCELRKYRLAVAATGEYTTFHGGKTNAVSAQVTTINRVNGIYEKTLAITFEIIPNNDLIVFTNNVSDGYTNGNAGAMINQNGPIINNALAAVGGGSNSYDIGHVFGTNSGGLAGLGVVCSGSKASGVTGSSAPVGDSFDVDYVAHEMGHQFGGSHTFNNSCNFNVSQQNAMEPGSGSTIMAYAGICSPNVQDNSDDYFHGRSIQQIAAVITGTNCAAKTTLNNSIPDITSTTITNQYVPKGTPIILTGEATDADAGDVLLYQWEQMNNQSSTQPPVPSSNNGPNFRSFTPTTSPTRYLPNLDDLRKGANPSPTWEVLPEVARTLKFRLVVTDNHSNGSCNDHKDINVRVDGNSGPFEVVYPNANGITWYQGGYETVLWDVAGSNASPVNCSEVDILLSTDNGATYPEVLATNVPNTGSYEILTPTSITTQARIMVRCSDQRFFNISNFRFTISSDLTSVEEARINKEFSLYPNPTKDNLTININNPKPTNVEIYDLRGKLIFSKTINNRTNEIDMSSFTNGMYVVKIENEIGVKTSKIIKE